VVKFLRMRTLNLKNIRFVFFLLGLASCDPELTDNALEYALLSKSEKIRKVIDSLSQYEVQILYTKINRATDSIIFTDYEFQVDSDNYFYPASTVKFPAVVATLEKLNETDSLDRDYRFYIEGDSTETTFAKDIIEIFAVSGNAPNNRLVEFLGFDDLNKRMQIKGVSPIRISHRLSTDNADNVTTKPLVLYLNDSTTISSKQIINRPPEPLQLNNTTKGVGFYAENHLYKEPFDFALKNYYPIKSQHALLKRIMFPENFLKKEQFNINKEQLQFLRNAMKILPREVGYDTMEFYDGYGKFFMFGDVKDTISNHIEIYNKVGYAYGTLTDCAYIKDTKNKIDFMLTATILVNKDGVFNDDNYEYEEIGIPFLAQLGRELYDYELMRKRK